MPVSETMMGPLVHASAPRRKKAARERDFDKGVGGGVDRDKLPEGDFAGPNRTYPIKTPGDVQDAASLVGKAADPDAVKRKIIAIAHRKGAAFVAQLPQAWRSKESVREAFRTHETLRALQIREAAAAKQPPCAEVLIIRAGPGNPADRHFYTADALRKSVAEGIWEGVPCFIDHPTAIEDKIIPERLVEKMAGYFRNARIVTIREGGKDVVAVQCELQPEIGNELVLRKLRTAVLYSQQVPNQAYVGFSINAEGVGQTVEIAGKAWNQVDEITKATSVDIVTKAGAGGKLLKFQEAYRMAEGATKTTEADDVSFSEAAKRVKEALAESGVQLTKDQDAAVDKALGVEDGSPLDKVIDQATGSEDFKQDGGDAEGGDVEEADREREKREAGKNALEADKEREADTAGAAEPDDVEEADKEDVEEAERDEEAREAATVNLEVGKMTRKQLEAALSEAITREAGAKREAATAKREATKAREAQRETQSKLTKILRERAVDEALADVPAGLQPRMKRMLMREAAAGVSDLKTIVSEEMALLAPFTSDGGGAVLRESGGTGKLKIDCFRPVQ